MSKRYYYTDAIVALYMMKEFELIIYDKNKDLFICYEPKFSLSKLLKVIEKLGKIYVPKELECIFEPKEGDKDENGLFLDGRHWTDGVSYAISSDQSKTSFRFGKQFFMPEVEYD